MCGIVGTISKKNISASEIKIMNDSIAHRGPDGEGFFFAGNFTNNINLEKIISRPSNNLNVAFGHRRLSIIDLSEQGQQPMSYMDRYFITYNGEIFNYIEIKEELKKLGYFFKSQTDTEVILAAYDAWGVDCQNKFNGMWAFALFDIEKETVFISRDRFGIKPLYFYQDDNNFIFASEIKALLKNDKVITTPSKNFFKDYFYEGANEHGQKTPFSNIYRFSCSCYTILNYKNLTDKISETRFWDYEVNTCVQEYNHDEALKYANEYFFLLKDAVRLRLRSDVDVCTTLSGGLDSASILYLICEIKKEDEKSHMIETFSTVYNQKETKEFDESYFINLITKKLKVKSNKFEPNYNEIPKLHSKQIKFWESPPDDIGMSGINTLRLISNSQFKVVLEGQGADEQQAGYMKYFINYLFQTPLINLYTEYKKIKKIHGSNKILNIGLIFSLACKVIGTKIAVKTIKILTKKDMSLYSMNLNQKLKLDTFKGLINLIHYGDRRSMMYSIEARMPYMDYRLVEFTAKIPSVYKIHNGWTKYFARLAFDGKLPNEITWRRDKMGWPTPSKYWFEGSLKDWLFFTINKSKFVKDEIKKLGLDINYSNISLEKMIRLLNISVWHEIFFENKNK